MNRYWQPTTTQGSTKKAGKTVSRLMKTSSIRYYPSEAIFPLQTIFGIMFRWVASTFCSLSLASALKDIKVQISVKKANLSDPKCQKLFIVFSQQTNYKRLFQNIANMLLLAVASIISPGPEYLISIYCCFFLMLINCSQITWQCFDGHQAGQLFAKPSAKHFSWKLKIFNSELIFWLELSNSY